MNRFDGKKLKEARRAKKFSRFHLAVAVGVTPQTIQNWEQGTNAPGANSLVEMAFCLGRSIEYFFVEGRTDA